MSRLSHLSSPQTSVASHLYERALSRRAASSSFAGKLGQGVVVRTGLLGGVLLVGGWIGWLVGWVGW